ncbi:MAG TPA: hypothetical protein VIA18_23650, partial [Polyangia bacterium]|nr:hypothetical protein [Polyangia bacterium]
MSIAVFVILAADLVAGKPSNARATILTLVALAAAAFATTATADPAGRGLFFGLMARDPLADFFTRYFLLANALVAVATWRAHDAIGADGDGAAELHALILTTTLG